MKKIICIGLLGVSFLFTQCCKKKSATSTPVESEVAPLGAVKEKELKTISIDPEYAGPHASDAFTMVSQKISGDSLLLEVQYGGGCKEHIFDMHTNLVWMKSMPPQLNLWLEHENNDDLCRALVTETLVFDLKNCRYAPGHEARIIINGDRENILKYTY